MRVSFARRVAIGVLAVTAAVCASAFTGGTKAANAVQHGLRVSSAPNHKISNSTSSNWSGYAVTGGRYTRVSASWTQPSVNCSVTNPTKTVVVPHTVTRTVVVPNTVTRTVVVPQTVVQQAPVAAPVTTTAHFTG